MSQAAKDIEAARRVYAAALNTPYEAAARRNLERVIEQARGK